MCCCGCGWYPERCGSTGTNGLSLSPWVVPRLLSTTITPSARTKHIYRAREDEQREHCVKGFCAFSLISFLTSFLLPGSSGHIHWTLPSVNSSPFSSHHPACVKAILTHRTASAPCSAVSSGLPTAFAEPRRRVAQRLPEPQRAR